MNVCLLEADQLELVQGGILRYLLQYDVIRDGMEGFSSGWKESRGHR